MKNSKRVFPRDDFSLLIVHGVREIGLARTDFVRSKQKTIQLRGGSVQTPAVSITRRYGVVTGKGSRGRRKDSFFPKFAKLSFSYNEIVLLGSIAFKLLRVSSTNFVYVRTCLVARSI